MVQKKWREQVESDIRAGTCTSFKKDWSNIRPEFPPRGQLTPSYYYIRPLAVFIPHLIVKDHTPWCPTCQSNAEVHTENYRFAENTKPLFGLNEQRELDTVFYTCYGGTGGKHTFCAHHPDSLRLGGPKLLGIFRFFVADQFAIDEPLHTLLIKQQYTPTAQIARMLRELTEKKYVSDMIEYYTRSVRGESRRMSAPVARHDDRQYQIRRFAALPTAAAAMSEVSAAARQLNRAKSDLASHKSTVERLKNRADDPIDLRTFVAKKQTKTRDSAPNISGLGPAKVRQLIDAGFVSFRQFLDEWRAHVKGEDTTDRVLAILEARQKANKQKDPTDIVHSWAKAVHEFLRE